MGRCAAVLAHLQSFKYTRKPAGATIALRWYSVGVSPKRIMGTPVVCSAATMLPAPRGFARVCRNRGVKAGILNLDMNLSIGFIRRLSGSILTLSLVASMPARAAQRANGAVHWTRTGDALAVSTPIYHLVMDARTGAPRTLTMHGRPALAFGAGGWWRLTFANGAPLNASDCRPQISHTGPDLHGVYTSPRAIVNLQVHFEEDRFDIRSTVQPGTGSAAAVTGLATPVEIHFAPDQLNRLYFPLELGIGLKRSFFEKQPEDHPAAWGRTSIGAAGAAAVGVSPTAMRDYNEPAVPAQVTPAGREWLGDAADSLNGWRVRTPRPPVAKPAVTLLDTSSGPLLSLERVDGGYGWFIRWGGIFSDQDDARVRLASARVAAALWQRPVASGDKIPAPQNWVGRPLREVAPPVIGIIDLDSSSHEADWRAALAPIGCTIRDLHSPTEILKSLNDRSCWLIVNPYDELLPATAERQQEMASAIRAYVAHGGVWLHTGAAPFFYVLQAVPYLTLTSSYPDAFSDFIHLDTASGQISVYGVRDPAAIFVPAQLTVSGGAGGGTVNREVITWVAPGQKWTAPITRFRFGIAAQKSIREYASANGFTRPLASKLSPARLAILKRSVLLNYDGATYTDEARGIALLPRPLLIHVADYLHGGFDKQYPDHLPPNPAHGTPGEFAAFIRAVHAAGDLFMPYTNPTWWCDHPRGPTFVRDGTAPLLKDRQGKNVREVYGPNDGWSLCAFHPDAIAAEKTILRQFTQQYPADVLFQDQIGARSPTYDFNPASPTPYAYTQGMLNIAGRDSKSLPLGTENGFDAAMNSETLFCGVAWGIVPTNPAPDWRQLWKNSYPAGTWQLAPLALRMAHDRVIFTLHDLGQFVTNRETLSWAMALGYHLSFRTNAQAVSSVKNRQWIDWLAALQKAIGPSLDGAPLTEWSEPAPGVYAARWGALAITANTTAAPYRINSRVTLSSYGFYVSDAGAKLTAGWLNQYEGHTYPDGYAFVRQGSRLSVYQPEGAVVVLPAGRPIRIGGAVLPARSTAHGQEVTLPISQPTISIPAALRGVAPRNRAAPPRFVGVIDIPWMTYGWASTQAADWEKGLAAPLEDLGLKVRPLRSEQDLKSALNDTADFLGIVNPYGEHFPISGPGSEQETLSAIRSYCEHGGAWFETSGYPFFQAVYAAPGGQAGTDPGGPGGLAFLGYHVDDLGNAPPPVTLQVTPVGKNWLGPALSATLSHATAVVNRPFAAGTRSLVLVKGAGIDYVAGVRPAGWGWLWRIGGSDPPASISIPVVTAILRRLDTSPPIPVTPSPDRYLYQLQL